MGDQMFLPLLPNKQKHQSEILSFLSALLNILFIYLFNSNTFRMELDVHVWEYETVKYRAAIHSKYIHFGYIQS